MPSLCARDIYQFVPRQKEGIQKRYTIPRHFHMKTYHSLVLSSQCPGRVVDILEACGAFDPGSNPGRGVRIEGFNPFFLTSPQAQVRDFRNIFES